MKSKLYDIFIAILAIISITLVVLDLEGYLSLNSTPFLQIDLGILGIFWIDYIYRLSHAEKKWKFVKSNIFDLLAIIPFYAFFTFFRVFRVFRVFRLLKLAKAARLVKVIAFTNKLNKNFDSFLKTNGLIYVIYISLITIIAAALLVGHFEKMSFGDSLWWSIVTCTTVGYGDFYPMTAGGRITATILMVVGVGLLGMITGTVATFFSKKNSVIESDRELADRINHLSVEKNKRCYPF